LPFGIFPELAADNKFHWDPTDDYSRQGLTTKYADEQYDPLYHNDVLVCGKEPLRGSSTPQPTA